MSEFLISIIMPTYNSEKTIEKSLQSIRRQTIDQSQVEILILDGGSKDATLEIALKYNATILKNERKLPEFAKQQGLMAAKDAEYYDVEFKTIAGSISESSGGCCHKKDKVRSE